MSPKSYRQMITRVQQAPHYYAMLEVHFSSTPEAIKAARRTMAHELHPDINGDPKAAEWMARVNVAADTLLDAAKTLQYLATLPQALCAQCEGRGFTYKQKGFKARTETICAACQGSGRCA